MTVRPLAFAVVAGAWLPAFASVAEPIDRQALLTRHNPRLVRFDPV